MRIYFSNLLYRYLPLYIFGADWIIISPDQGFVSSLPGRIGM